MKKTVFIASAITIFLAPAISACGTTGDLEAAPPMWGKAKEEYKAKKEQEKEQQKQKEQDQKN